MKGKLFGFKIRQEHQHLVWFSNLVLKYCLLLIRTRVIRGRNKTKRSTKSLLILNLTALESSTSIPLEHILILLFLSFFSIVLNIYFMKSFHCVPSNDVCRELSFLTRARACTIMFVFYSLGFIDILLSKVNYFIFCKFTKRRNLMSSFALIKTGIIYII
uniref:Uncharacterized protein n=1 Tax=Cacopsylla melanoneura TaxID=428564 RepID=A0A8D9AQR2_9HEMI